MPKQNALKTDFRPGDRRLTLAFLLGPVAALGNVTVSYILTTESCIRDSKLMLHLSAAAFLLLAFAAAALAWSRGRTLGEIELEDVRERTQWMISAAIVLAMASAVVIVATEIPNLILRSCD
jgi:hypothetical protein